MERNELEQNYSDVIDTDQLRESFTVQSFQAPFVRVMRKVDGKTGTLEFQHRPRFYFNFVED